MATVLAPRLLADDERDRGRAVEEGGGAGILDAVDDLGEVADADRAAPPRPATTISPISAGVLDLAAGLDGELAAAGWM
jgi:hypothetical protein